MKSRLISAAFGVALLSLAQAVAADEYSGARNWTAGEVSIGENGIPRIRIERNWIEQPPAPLSDTVMLAARPLDVVPANYDLFDDPSAGAQDPWAGAQEPSAGAQEPSAGCDKPWAGCAEPLDDCEPICCAPCWRFFGEFLYLRPRDAEVAFAVPIDGAIVPPPAVPIQVGPTGIVDPDFQPGYRAGFAFALDECSTLGITYASFESHTFAEIEATAPIVVRSMVIHPASPNAATDFLAASANHDVDFDLIDADYRRILAADAAYELAYVVGARYASLEQDFSSQFASLGTETITSRLQFDGGGVRLGLEGERRFCGCGLMLYGRGAASFVAGEFRGRYFQGNTFDPVIVDTTWKAGRIVSILDLEMGVGWVSSCERVRLTAGYQVSTWLNAVTTADYIQAVQANSYAGLDGSLSFDGFVARAEVRF